MSAKYRLDSHLTSKRHMAKKNLQLKKMRQQIYRLIGRESPPFNRTGKRLIHVHFASNTDIVTRHNHMVTSSNAGIKMLSSI